MTAPRRPPGRYDERRPMSRSVLVTLATVLGVGLLVLTYLAYGRFTTGRTTATVLGYTVVDDHTVKVRFEVTKKADATVRCLVRARDRDSVEVGAATVTLGPGTSKATYSLTTIRRAAIGEVVSCGP